MVLNSNWTLIRGTPNLAIVMAYFQLGIRRHMVCMLNQNHM